MAKLINILLQKSNPNYPWGFTIGTDTINPSLRIISVDGGSLASAHLEVGDRVLELEGIDSALLSNQDTECLLKNSNKKLELLVMKKPSLKREVNDPELGREKGNEFWTAPKCAATARDSVYKSSVMTWKEKDFKEELTRNGESIYKREEREGSESKETEWKENGEEINKTKEEKSWKEKEKFGTPWRRREANSEPTTRKEFNRESKKEEEVFIGEKTERVDGRENKRQFWESCNREESWRRVRKWGESIKPKRIRSPGGTRSDGSTESLNEVQEKIGKKTGYSQNQQQQERARSCEPCGIFKSNNNPFYESVKEKGVNLKSSNPFLYDCFRESSNLNTESKGGSIEYVDWNKLVSSSKEETQSTHKKAFNKTCEFFEEVQSTSPKTVTHKNAKEIIREHLNSRLDWRRKTFKGGNKMMTRNRSNTESLFEAWWGEESSKRAETPSGFYDNIHTTAARSNGPTVIADVQRGKGDGEERDCSETNKRTDEDEEDFLQDVSPVRSEERIEQEFQELAREEGLLQEQVIDWDFDKIRQSSQISGGGSPGAMIGPVGAPPPPPPPGSAGGIPSVRIPSEIPLRKEPPAAIQNAMMTKDKKPFTYTPGGLDLAEIRSPRMQRRISRNAHTEDSCSPQLPKASQPSPLAQQTLPPSVVAAMQPQIAIPVFPPGSAPTPPGIHPPPPIIPNNEGSPSFAGPSPPPPPPFPSSSGASFPPPPPPMSSSFNSAPVPPPLPPQSGPNETLNGGPRAPPYLADIQNRPQLRPVTQLPAKSPVDYVSEIPNRAPLRPVHFGSKSSKEPSPPPFQNQVNLKPLQPQVIQESPQTMQNQIISSRPPSDNMHNKPKVYIPPQETICISSNQQSPVRNTPLQQNTPIRQTPPPQTPPVRQTPPPQTPPVRQTPPPQTPPIWQSPPPQTQPIRQTPPPQTPPAWQNIPPQTPPVRQTPSSPSTMNKSPAPWMTSQKPVQKDVPPWASRENQVLEERKMIEESHSAMVQGHTRIIPIQIEGREPSQPPHPTSHPDLPIMFQTLSVNSENKGKTRIIPIQMEGANDEFSQPQQVSNQQSKPGGAPNRFQSTTPQSPTGFSYGGDFPDGRGRPPLQSQVSWTQGNTTPIQSRSFRMLQKITGSEDQDESDPRVFSTPAGNGAQPGQVYFVNRVFPQDPDNQNYGGPPARTQSMDNSGHIGESEY